MATKKYSAIAELYIRANRGPYDATMKRLKASAAKDGASIGQALTTAIGIAAIKGYFVKVFATFEAGLSEVKKVSGLTSDELKALGEQIRAVAKESVFGTKDLLDIAAASARLGVKGRDNIMAYTEAIAKLAAASDFSPDEAATAMARFSNVAGLTNAQVDNLASTFVALAASLPVTESELQDSAIAVAAAGRSYGLTADQALGMAAAFAAAGQASFANGTAVGRFFSELGIASRKGGAKLQAFADVMGVTTTEVVRLFKEEGAEAFRLYTEGLKKFGHEQDVMLTKSGITEAKAQRLFKSAGDVIGASLKTASEGFKDGAAHIREAETMVDNLKGSFDKLVNALDVLAGEIGEELAPAFRSFFDTMREWLNSGGGDKILKFIRTFGVFIFRASIAFASFKVVQAGVVAGVKRLGIALLALVGQKRVINGVRDLTLGFSRMARQLGFHAVVRGLGRQFTIMFSDIARGLAGTGAGLARLQPAWLKAMTQFITSTRAWGWAARFAAGGFKALAGAVKLARVAFGILLPWAMLFLPEMARYLYRVFPDALDYLVAKGGQFAANFKLFFVGIYKGWVDYANKVLDVGSMLVGWINETFGTKLEMPMAATFKAMQEGADKMVAELEKDNERMARKSRLAWARIKKDSLQAMDEIADSAKSMAGIVGSNFESTAQVGPGATIGPAGMGAKPPAPPPGESAEAKAEREAREAQEAKAEAERIAALEEAQRQQAWDMRRLNELGRNAQEEVNIARRTAEEEEAIAREKAAAQHAQDMRRLNELGRHAEEEVNLAREKAAAVAAAEEEIAAHELETELTLYKMKLDGKHELEISHYEAMRELELEIKEARLAEDAEEEARLQRKLDHEVAMHRKALGHKIADEFWANSRSLKEFAKHSKGMAKLSYHMGKAEALYTLAVRGPTDMAKAYGMAAGYFPPPLGTALGIAAAAAVAAKYTAAVRAAHEAKPVAMSKGGVVPGPFSLNDTQRALLTPGEVVAPVKNYGDIEEGIRARVRREQAGGDYQYPGPQELDIKLHADEDLAHIISVQADAAEVRRQ